MEWSLDSSNILELIKRRWYFLHSHNSITRCHRGTYHTVLSRGVRLTGFSQVPSTPSHRPFFFSILVISVRGKRYPIVNKRLSNRVSTTQGTVTFVTDQWVVTSEFLLELPEGWFLEDRSVIPYPGCMSGWSQFYHCYGYCVHDKGDG